MRRFGPDCRVAVEALGLNRWFVNACLGAGLDVRVCDPRKLDLEKLGRKADRRDAREIARRLWRGDLDRVARTYGPSDFEHGRRKLLRVRHRLVQMRQQTVNPLRGMLQAYQAPRGVLYTRPSRARLAAIPMVSNLRRLFLQHLVARQASRQDCPMLELEIRRACPEDVEAAVAVWERARWDAEPWLEQRMNYSHAANVRHFRDVVMRQNTLWLAVDGQEIVGLLALGESQIDQLYVEPSRQGQGIGTALLDRAKELAPEGLTLFTHQRNQRARGFYERRGFRALKFGVSPPPESEPDVRYKWEPTGGR